ncbi:HAD family hydrolase [Beggiatoa leptomitoformis]|uniref:HAD-IA family hydrolase n=1 Tax=Beggiatoa leptomitoformis TaxID=288004 RepID=A0A2N9YCW9_9GAMM|nr:HAD family hydrolase [Beggiatoa leptomitoformis]ALG69249.1 HAD-IA family hydrolase [Beggiatoa leptomitoformis]AUI68313.1 HAD-IA family hydrolase [Beggiatoa leptomitoformis]
MPQVLVGTKIVDIDLIVFDKDGTLIDFFYLWGQKARQSIETLVARVEGDNALLQAICARLGCDLGNNRVVSDSDMACATIADVHQATRQVLCDWGLSIEQAELATQTHFTSILMALPDVDMIRPIGSLNKFLQDCQQIGIKIGVVTSDYRAGTQFALETLDISAWVDVLVCGDDALTSKPSPAPVLHIATQCQIKPQRMMVVGDSSSDLLMGKNAGVACCVGVLTGTGTQESLQRYADIVVESIADIQIIS